ncbi:hypothetical protein [Rubritalea profundi]|uniref:Uncharacterized protein n=1 Tax=Rubritalea profundi TaxID=1658618 RepID=A0A2S7TYM3_9BACT|nr:hypothetical protein [Rubritalea profundi]PQJ27420.1 hypothetical protein BSZ32_02185 [Rubritalea profundi]
MNEIIDQLFEKITERTHDLDPIYYQKTDNFHTELGIVYQYGLPQLERNRFVRRLHDIASDVLEELSFGELHEIASVRNLKRIWEMPAALNDNPRNRRRLHAHAMHHLVSNYALSTYPQLLR